MQLIKEIPDHFWSLFRSGNRVIYMEALLKINEEYQYNNYYLSREMCIQILGNYFSQRKFDIIREEQETEADVLEPPATRVLNWLVRAGWLKRLEDYVSGITNIIIPDYAAVFLDAFERLYREEEDETEVYIQNVYALLFSYLHDPKAGEGLLKTAVTNTRRLNKALQDMLHNMDKFFGSLLEKETYGEVLKEHLNGYVEEIVKKKYSILKTSDNFYLYKNNIKNWLQEISEQEGRALAHLEEHEPAYKKKVRILEMAGEIERGFADIEHRISNMDKEHMKYVRATVTRLNYLLNEDQDMKGLVIRLLNHLSDGEEAEEKVRKTASYMNFSQVSIFSEKSLYKRRRDKKAFREELESDIEEEELDRKEVLKWNRIRNRYSRERIEEFILERMTDGRLEVTEETVCDEEAFEMLILAYDDSIRKNSRFYIRQTDGEIIKSGKYRFPKLIFEDRKSIPGVKK